MKRIKTLLLILIIICGSSVYGIVMAENPPEPIYDPQPQSPAEVTSLLTGFIALPPDQQVQSAKPHWEFPVAMPIANLRCEYIEYDEVFGAPYYTFVFLPSIDGLVSVNIYSGSASDLQNAINNAAALQRTVIYIHSDINLGSSAITVPPNKKITIISGDPAHPVTLTQSNTGTRHFTVDGTLDLRDIILDGAYSGGGVSVGDGGILEMYCGAVIQNCMQTSSAPAMAGGGVSVWNGSFMMDGGKIIRNSGYNGGGVALNTGEFKLYSGEITENWTNNVFGLGGGVAVYSDLGHTYPTKVMITGGAIKGNTSYYGGGLLFSGALGTPVVDYAIHDGTISGNTAVGQGGGVYVGGDNRFAMTGGLLANNSAGQDGGGLFARDGSVIRLSGGVVIRENAAAQGGGIYGAGNASTLCDIELNRVSVINNTARNIESSHDVAGYGGGGIYADYARVQIENGSLINGNKSNHNGGGITVMSSLGYNEGYVSLLTIYDSTVSENTAAVHGGGVYVAGSYVYMRGGALSKNTASGENSRGGGFYAGTGSSVDMGAGAVVEQNTAAMGGGIFITNSGLNPLSVLIVNGSGTAITGNKAAGGSGMISNGGGIFAENSTVSVSGGVKIHGNEADGIGGGIFAYRATSVSPLCAVTIDNSEVSGNTAKRTEALPDAAGYGGGGIYASKAYVAIRNNSQIKDNISGHNGGGVSLTQSTLDVTGSTVISGNRATGGGGIYATLDSVVTADNARVGMNKALAGGGIYATSFFGPTTGNKINVKNGAIVGGNSALSGHGGGIYVSAADSLSVTGTSKLANNSAPNGNGGGIYTGMNDYSNLDILNTVVFSGNSASRDYPPPEDAQTLSDWSQFIKTVSSSLAEYSFPVNNCDINAFAHTVAFDAGGGSAVTSQSVAFGTKVAEPPSPTKAGYSFLGWYKESGHENEWDFESDIISGDITLFADWAPLSLDVRIPVKLLWAAFEEDNAVISPDYQIINNSVFPIEVSGTLIESDDSSGESINLVDSADPEPYELRLEVVGGDDFIHLAQGTDNPFSDDLNEQALLMDEPHAFGFLGGTLEAEVDGTEYASTGWFRFAGAYGGPFPEKAIKPVYAMEFFFRGVFPPATAGSILPLHPPDDPARGFLPRVPGAPGSTNDFRGKIKGQVLMQPLGLTEIVSADNSSGFPDAYWQLKNIIHPSVTDYSGIQLSVSDPKFTAAFRIGSDCFGRPSIICDYVPSVQEYKAWVNAHGTTSVPEYTVEAILTLNGQSAAVNLTIVYDSSVNVLTE